MTPEEFDQAMRRMDAALAQQGVPLMLRPIGAWFGITGAKELCGPTYPDPRLGPFEGPNLIETISKWYKQHYPVHSLIPYDWGSRLLLLRGEVFQVRVPMILNAIELPPARQYVTGLSPELFAAICDQEREYIQGALSVFYRQGSALALCHSVYVLGHHETRVAHLIDAA